MSDADFDHILESIRKLGQLPEEVARTAAPLVEAAVKRTAAAGTSPDGTPWPDRKAGGRALANAASAVTCVPRGTVVSLELGATATGSVKVQAIQNATRSILPRPGEPLPDVVVDAIRKASKQAFEQATGGR